ncbi:hypothetical protein Droror1_Dr00016490 [Drosera rotundifolia]
MKTSLTSTSSFLVFQRGVSASRLLSLRRTYGGSNANNENVTYLYKLVPGISERSFGFKVAQLAQKGKIQNSLSHGPKIRTAGFSVNTGQGSPSEAAAQSKWFKPEIDSPSSIRSIQIEEKAMKDLRRFYSNVKLVTSLYGNSYHSAENLESGQFAFTAAESGDYMACFWLPEYNPVITMTVEFEWRSRVAWED